MDRRIRTSLCSIATDVGLSGFKGWLAFFTGSLALQADAYHSLSDLTVSLCVLMTLGIRKGAETLARRSARKRAALATSNAEAAGALRDAGIVEETAGSPLSVRANWILKGLETLLALAVACLILRLAYSIWAGFQDVGPMPVAQGWRLWVAIGGTGLCALVAGFIGHLKLKVGRETDSPALEADGHHSRMDMLTSVGVLFSLLGHQIGIELDPLCAVVIAVLIALVGINLLLTALLNLKAQGGLVQQSAFGLLTRRLWPYVRRVLTALFGDPLRWPRLLDPRFGRFWALLALLAFCAWGSTAICVIPPHQQGLHQRFGRVLGVFEPGFHLHAPWPIDRVRHLEPGRILRVETGFRIDQTQTWTSSPPRWAYPQLPQGYHLEPEESFVVTADENLLDVALVIHAKARDAQSALLRLSDPVALLRGMAEVNLRAVAARLTLDDWLVEHRRDAFEAVRQGLQRDCDAYGLDTEILAVYGHDVHPPTPVIEAFRNVFSAREDQSTALHKANTYQQSELARARGDAYSKKIDAELAQKEAIFKAEGDATAFEAQAQAFLRAPALQTTRLTIDALERGLAGKAKVIAEPSVNRQAYQRWLFAPEQPNRRLKRTRDNN